MKVLCTLALIGGLSWHSTLEYYRHINASVQAQLGEYRSAPLLISSLDFGPIVEHQLQKNWEEAGRILALEAKKLENAGAQAIMICSNTMHRVSRQVEEAVDIPLIHIASAIARELRARDKSEAVLLGTRYTMADSFLYEALKAEGIQATPPERPQAKAINEAIFKRLVRGEIAESDQQLLAQIVRQSEARPERAVVLACTELGMLLTDEIPQVKLIDSATAHAQLAVDYILGRYHIQALRRHPQSWLSELESASPSLLRSHRGEEFIGFVYPERVPKVLQDINTFPTDKLRKTLDRLQEHIDDPDSLEFEWDHQRIHVTTEQRFSIVEDLGNLEPRFQISTDLLIGIIERTLALREEAIAKEETKILVPVHFSRGSWALIHSPEIGYFMSVMVGSIGLYEIDFVLSGQETDAFESGGVSYLEQLAKNVRNNPQDYTKRDQEFRSEGIPEWRCPPLRGS